MVNKSKRQRISTSTEEHQSLPSNTHSESQASDKGKQVGADKGKQKATDNLYEMNSDEYSRSQANTNPYDVNNTFQVGTMVITPQPRQQLSTQTISLILHHLPRQQRKATLHACTLVSRDFHTVANALLWEVFNFSDVNIRQEILEMFGYCYNINTDRFLTSLYSTSLLRSSALGHHIQDIRFNSTQWTDERLLRFLPHIAHIKHLTLWDDANITDTSFQHLPRHCQQLQTLKLYSNRIEQLSFINIGQYCHDIVDLECALMENQPIEWLALLRPCPLTTLRIMCTLAPWNETTLSILKSWRHLTCLDISVELSPGLLRNFLLLATTNNNDNDNTIGSNSNNNTTDWWPYLTKLILAPCEDIDNGTFIDFIKTHPYLQHIELSRIQQLSDVSLVAMGLWLPNLTHLMLMHHAQVTFGGIRQLIWQTNQLEYIRINSYYQSSWDDVMARDAETRFTGVLKLVSIVMIKHSQSV